MASVSILCIVVMAKLWSNKGFNFLTWMCVIILVTDLGILMLVVALKLDASPLRTTWNV